MVRKKSSSESVPTQSAQRPIIRDVNAAVRVKKALELRLHGYTYDQIAEMAGYGNRGTAWHAIQRELERSLLEPSEDVRTLELLRLDILLTRQMQIAREAGNIDASYATANCLKIMERRAALLGLDAEPNGGVTAQVLIREYAVPLEGV